MTSRRAARALLVVVLLVLGALAGAGPASAHAELESSDPKDGATLDAVPAAVVLTFGEEIEPTLVRARVDRPDGSRTDVTPTTRGAEVTVPVGGEVATGRYAVVFRVVSADGHPVSGRVRFTVEVVAQESTPTTPAATPTETPPTTPAATPTTDPSTDPTTTTPPTVAPTTIDGEPTAATETSSATAWIVGGLGLLSVAIGAAAFLYVRSRQQP